VSLFEISGLFAAGLCSIALLSSLLARKLPSKPAPRPAKIKPPKKVPERYARFAEAFAMNYSSAWDGNAFLKGFVGAVSVELVSHGRSLGLVVAPPGLPWSWFTEAYGSSPPIVFGIPELDSILHFSGDEAQLVAALDAPTRQLYLECDCTFTRGKLTHEANHSVFSDRASEGTLIERARKMVALGTALAQAPLPAKLANNAAADPLPVIRLRNLQILAAKFADSDEAPFMQVWQTRTPKFAPTRPARILAPQQWPFCSRRSKTATRSRTRGPPPLTGCARARTA
jgi:hypothetical protein